MHDLFEILSALPNPEQTAYQVKHRLQWQLLQHGRAYAEIVRTDGRITALWPLSSERMRVDRDEQRRKRWTYTAADGRQIVWTFNASQPPIFELTHETPIARFPVRFGERAHGHSHWNVNWAAKVKFIRRTIDYSFRLRRKLASA